MEMKPGYKWTEVGVIPENWVLAPLREVAPLQRGFDLPTSQIRPGPYPVVYSNGALEQHDRSMVKSPGVVTGRSGTIGRVHFIEKDYWPHNTSLWVTSFCGNDPKFIYYLYTHVHLNRLLSGSGVPTLNRNDVHQHMVACPTLAEQRAIAEALSDADALIESLEQLLTKKRHIKNGVMQELLTGKKPLSSFGGVWEVKRLGEIARLYQPRTISAKQFTRSGYPVYGANGVVGFYREFNHDTWQITVTCRGSTCGTVNRTVEKSWVTGNAMVVNCDQNGDLNKNFLYYLLLSQDLSFCITGTGQPQIVREPLANFEVPVPRDLREQTAIATILSDIDAEIAALEAKLSKARQIKQGMMQELLTGRTRLV